MKVVAKNEKITEKKHKNRYIFRFENNPFILGNFSQQEVANEIGINRTFLNNVLNRKKTCSKLTAYAITKWLDKSGEIEDYFRLYGIYKWDKDLEVYNK